MYYKGEMMANSIDSRVLKGAYLFVKNGSTVREVAKTLGCSKSTVHKDFTERLQYIDDELYLKVKNLLEYNKQVRHIRGGESTRRRYVNEKGYNEKK